jgi:HD superfamily phosphohydrolase
VIDPLHGRVTLTEPLLVDLLASPAVRRLRGVHLGGITGLLRIAPTATRFEHSIGTLLLVRRLGGSLKEQAAALLHDVSHTAFSHVVDFLFDSPRRQGFHDDVKETYVADTDIPQICARHDIDWRLLLDERRFAILEQPAPRLCADRIDYGLRDAVGLGLLELDEARTLLERLTLFQGRVVMDDIGAARRFAEVYLRCDERLWSNLRDVGLYELTARALRRGLEVGAVQRGHLWTTDEELWARLWAHPDPELRRLLGLVSGQTTFLLDPRRPDFHIRPKARTVDPEVQRGAAVRPLSEVDAEYARLRQEHMRSRAGVWPVRVVAR